ncbi:MAG: flagellar protein FlaG [Acidobacteria bacterium]|nr:flagellar protein FlaG [Acidobacteriota bacterium]
MDVGSVRAEAVAIATLQPAPTPENNAERRQLIRAVQALNATEMFGQDNELTFVLDRETRRPLVRIVDKRTNEVIRQIPPEYALRMAEYLKLDRD